MKVLCTRIVLEEPQLLSEPARSLTALKPASLSLTFTMSGDKPMRFVDAVGCYCCPESRSTGQHVVLSCCRRPQRKHTPDFSTYALRGITHISCVFLSRHNDLIVGAISHPSYAPPHCPRAGSTLSSLAVTCVDQVAHGHRGYRPRERQPLPLLRQPCAAIPGHSVQSREVCSVNTREKLTARRARLHGQHSLGDELQSCWAFSRSRVVLIFHISAFLVVNNRM